MAARSGRPVCNFVCGIHGRGIGWHVRVPAFNAPCHSGGDVRCYSIDSIHIHLPVLQEIPEIVSNESHQEYEEIPVHRMQILVAVAAVIPCLPVCDVPRQYRLYDDGPVQHMLCRGNCNSAAADNMSDMFRLQFQARENGCHSDGRYCRQAFRVAFTNNICMSLSFLQVRYGWNVTR